MKLAVISDLHLGAADAADGFGHRDRDFLRFLAFLEANFERVVLLGDIWETLTTRRFGNPKHGLLVARRAHPRIAQRLLQPQYVYVHGNHDMVAGHSDAAPALLTLQANGTRILFTHGHHHDWLVRRARWLSESAVWLGGWLRRLGLGSMYHAFDRLDTLRNRHHVPAEASSFQRWAVRLARQRGAEVVVTGHTHIAARQEHGDRLFLNSGSCARGKFSFLSLDTRAGAYAVHGSW